MTTPNLTRFRRTATVSALGITLTAGLIAVPARTDAAPVAKSAPQPVGPTLNIGDRAPLLKPAKWLKGEPLPTFEKGRVYVVEFWATWCGPCKANIPHLTAMAKKYKGKAEIIGVDIWESSDPTIKTLPRVEKFVVAQGKQMDYHVAADATNNRVANAWMKAAGLNGIPASFIVGRDGRIAWIGNPATGLDAALEKVVSGNFNVAAARAQRDKQNGPMQAIDNAFAAKDYPTALKLVDAMIAKNPAAERGFTLYRLMALAHTNLPEFKVQVRKVLTEAAGEISVYQMVCSIPASDKGLSPDAYRFGRGLVDEALVKKEREYLFYAMGAAIDSSLGDKAGAVTAQAAAVKAAETDTHCPPEFLEFLKKSLDKYKAAAGA
ncbi:MAG: TlpA disulfide reductase family protein [Armatimonadota bacterium]